MYTTPTGKLLINRFNTVMGSWNTIPIFSLRIVLICIGKIITVEIYLSLKCSNTSRSNPMITSFIPWPTNEVNKTVNNITMHGIAEIYHCWRNTSLPSITIKIFSKDERCRYRIFILFLGICLVMNPISWTFIIIKVCYLTI